MRVIAHVEPTAADRRPAKLLHLAYSSERAIPRKAEASIAPRQPRDNRIHWGIALFWLGYFALVTVGAIWTGWSFHWLWQAVRSHL